ncbi:MAG: WD40 repeat domain-containing protein [Chloroflexales bacterium]
MPYRLRPLLLILLLLTACSGPPLVADTPSPTPPLTAEAVPRPAPADPPTPRPAPTPVGPLTRIATWGDGIPLGAAYTPDGQSIAVLRPAALELRPAARPTELRWRIDLDGGIPTALALAPDGVSIAVSIGSAITIYAAADGTRVGAIPGLGAPIADIAISPDGRLLAAAQDDEIVSLWDLAERSALRELRLPQSDTDGIVPGAFTSVAFSPDRQSIMAGDTQGNVTVWGIADGAAIQARSVGSRVVADVAFSPDSRSIAAASEGWRAEPGAIWLWDIASGTELHWLSIDDTTRFLAPAKRLTFAPDGSQVLMGLADGSILRWSLANGSLTQELPGHLAALTALAYSPDGARILSASRDGSLRMWQADGTPAEVIVGIGAISAVAISPDGSLVISGDEGGAIDIRHPDGALLIHISAKIRQVNALSISPDGTTLAAAGDDGSVHLWSLPSGDPLGDLHRPKGYGATRAVAFSPDGTTLAAAGYDGILHLWRVPNEVEERAVAVLETDGISSTSLWQIAFSSDGNMIAVAGNEGAVSLWRRADLTLIERRAIQGSSSVSHVAFAPNGTIIAAAYINSDQQLYTWTVPGAPPLALIRPAITDFAILPDGDLATLNGTTLTIWRGPADALAAYAAAAATGFSSLAVGPHTIAIGSRLGSIEVWAVR